MTDRSFFNDRIVPSIQDRKRAMFSQKEFMATVDHIIESSARTSGTFSHFVTSLPFATRGVYAASLKSLTMPQSFGNVYEDLGFDIKYTNVVAFNARFDLTAGSYFYSPNAGTVTYATAAAAPSPSSNLIYYVLQWFAGGVDSITVDPITGAWNWSWDASTGGAASTNVPDFFQFADTTGLTWTGNGNPINLAGCQTLAIRIPELSGQKSKSNVTGLPNYFATIPINASFGDVIAYEPVREDISMLGGSTTTSSITVEVVDTRTNEILPLHADWSMCLRLYVSQEQVS